MGALTMKEFQDQEMMVDNPVESFDDLTEQDIILLWRSFKMAGLSGDEAWHAIMTGMALDMAFARTQGLSHIEH